MADAYRWLLDTNILLRMTNQDDPSYHLLQKTIRVLLARGAKLCFTTQTLGEFWNVSTRPLKENGFGMNVAEVDHLTSAIEREFEFLPDGLEVHRKWRKLLVAHEVRGVQVHDTRLAASMYVRGVSNMLTFNGRDFRRFNDLRAVHPAEVLRGA